MSSSTLFHLFLLSSLLFSCLSNARPDEDDFSYIEGSPNGPENWGNLNPEWKTCGNGMEQSPINLCDDRVIQTPALGKLRTSYQAARATLKNNGHDIMVNFKSDAGSQFINQVQYQLKRIHFHSPSEHALNGERFDLEVQMVHESQDQRRAVTAILFRFGRSDPFLSDLEDFISQISNSEKNEVDAGVVDPRQLLQFDDPAYYRYMGSFTAPPCTEDITWTVIKKLGTVSPRQVLMLKQAVNENAINNARPLQSQKFRTVFFYPRQKSNHVAI
uniref:Dioscorin 1 n=1 Tax=Dioscorea japonica TaxID=4673 RepID=A7MAP8_DIOJA|nr:dioscorin 1 precursor [Dioscorea japonica]